MILGTGFFRPWRHTGTLSGRDRLVGGAQRVKRALPLRHRPVDLIGGRHGNVGIVAVAVAPPTFPIFADGRVADVLHHGPEGHVKAIRSLARLCETRQRAAVAPMQRVDFFLSHAHRLFLFDGCEAGRVLVARGPRTSSHDSPSLSTSCAAGAPLPHILEACHA